ncbi:MAG: hypothetical protein OXB88_10215 [Bacteriovoracales bacterium]|nr:hypothetical protein [Bacteriovoracales bacterium]
MQKRVLSTFLLLVLAVSFGNLRAAPLPVGSFLKKIAVRDIDELAQILVGSSAKKGAKALQSELKTIKSSIKGVLRPEDKTPRQVINRFKIVLGEDHPQYKDLERLFKNLDEKGGKISEGDRRALKNVLTTFSAHVQIFEGRPLCRACGVSKGGTHEGLGLEKVFLDFDEDVLRSLKKKDQRISLRSRAGSGISARRRETQNLLQLEFEDLQATSVMQRLVREGKFRRGSDNKGGLQQVANDLKGLSFDDQIEMRGVFHAMSRSFNSATKKDAARQEFLLTIVDFGGFTKHRLWRAALDSSIEFDDDWIRMFKQITAENPNASHEQRIGIWIKKMDEKVAGDKVAKREWEEMKRGGICGLIKR